MQEEKLNADDDEMLNPKFDLAILRKSETN